MGVSKLDVSIVERPAPARGPSSSSDYNAFVEETINSAAQIAISWNEDVQPLLDSLPSGGVTIIREDRTDSPNPFLNGFDGSQVYLDMTSTVLTDEGKYFSESLNRPLTIKETVENVQEQLNDSVQDILVKLAQVEQNTGITARQKQAIGSRIFDPETTSNPTSIDGTLNTVERNLDQVALDIAGDLDYLNNNGAKSLDHTILSQLDAIQTEHNYNPVTNEIDHSHLPLHIHRYHVDPVGALDGVNKEYEIPGGEKFIIGSTRVMVNGLELRKSHDYIERPDRRAIQLTASHRALENDANGADDYIWIHYDIDPNDP
jgi:hypothetical protein